MPLGPAVDTGVQHGGEQPIAIACVKDGRDARCCPQCGREFLMKAAFVDKTIRCRGCKQPFRVKISEPAEEQKVPSVGRQAHAAPPRLPASSTPSLQLSEKQQPVPATAAPQPMIFEDIGDVLDDIVPGEQVPTVVRPRNAPIRATHGSESFLGLIAVLFGGACALPLAQLILWWGFGKDPLGIGPMLPLFLRSLAPERFWH